MRLNRSSGFSPSPPRGHEERTAERCRCSFPTSGGAPTHFCIVYVCCFKLFFLSSKLFTCFFFFVLYQLWCIVNFLVDFGFMFTRFRFSLLCNRLISLFITKKLVRGMFQISSDAKTKISSDAKTKITRMLSSLSLFFYRQLSL